MIFYFFTAFFVYTFHSPIPRPVPCGAVVAEIWHGAMGPRPPTVIRSRSADNRKALLWAGSFPPPTVILSRRRRILVHVYSDTY